MVPIHPLTVHFPIGLIIFGGILYLLAFLLKKPVFDFDSTHFKQAALLTHLFGLLGIGIAIFTGNLAEDDVVHTLQLHEMVERHELIGFVAAWLFGVLFLWVWIRKNAFLPIEKIFFLLLFWVGIGVVIYTSHLGGRMVYEEGSGVAPMQEKLENIKQIQDSDINQ